jgi:uncharacterized tellurite resistance protein B-like protein
MSLLSSLKSFFLVQQAKRWSDDERKALVRLAYDIITADGIVDAAELKTIEEACKTYDVDLSEITQLGLGWAMGILGKDRQKLRVACLVSAPYFFADGDLDAAERKFIETLSTRYQIPDDVLKLTVESIRKEKLDDALKALHDEAFSAGAETPSEDVAIAPDAHRRDVGDV